LTKYFVGLLDCHVGSSPHHVKNLADLVSTLGSVHTRPQDIIASFDVVPFFVREAMGLLGQHAGRDILRLLPCPDLLLQF
jgi:hypothetical protein